MQLLTFTLTGMDYGISLENVESIESKMNVVVVPTSPANIREASSAFTERSCRCFPLHPDLDWGTLRWTTLWLSMWAA